MTRINRRPACLSALAVAALFANIFLWSARRLPRVPVEIMRAEAMPLLVSAPGVIEATRSVTLKAEFDGPVLTKNYQEGQAVREGDVLLELGRGKIAADYESKIAALRLAQADFQRAEKEVKLQRLLFAKQAVAASAVDDAESALLKAKQAATTARLAFEQGSASWHKNKFAAPFSGTIVKDYLSGSGDVTAGKEVLTLADLSTYDLKARVPEMHIRRLAAGQPTHVRLPAYPENRLSGRVNRIGALAEGADVPEVPVFVDLDSVKGLPLIPQLSAEAQIETGRLDHVLSVPLEAIDNRYATPAVWVVGFDSRLHRQPVTLGQSNPARVEITGGLRAGSRVASAFDPQWRPGIKVRIAS